MTAAPQRPLLATSPFQLLERALTRWFWVFAVSVPIWAIATVVAGVASGQGAGQGAGQGVGQRVGQAQVAVLAAGSGSSSLQLPPSGAGNRIRILAAEPALEAFNGLDSCAVAGKAARPVFSGSAFEHDGVRYAPFLEFEGRWQSAEVRCTGQHIASTQLLVVQDERRRRMALTALLALMTIGSAVMTVLGLAARRSAPGVRA